MTGHKHADAMAQYAEDAKHHAEPWKLWEWQWADTTNPRKWSNIGNNPNWGMMKRYRRKPRTININGYEVPEPLRVGELKGDEMLYMVNLDESRGYTIIQYGSREGHYQALVRGLLHLTKEEAGIHAEALLSFTRGV